MVALPRGAVDCVTPPILLWTWILVQEPRDCVTDALAGINTRVSPDRCGSRSWGQGGIREPCSLWGQVATGGALLSLCSRAIAEAQSPQKSLLGLQT